MRDLAYHLKEKGWTKKEIVKAMRIIEDAKKNKSKPIIFLDKVVYWFALILAIVGNLFLSVVLIPFLMVLNSVQSYFFIITISFSFGFLFSSILKDIDGLDKRHHVIAGIFIPCLALINVYVMVDLANYIDEALGITVFHHNPIIVSIVYALFFVIPYLLNLLLGNY